MLNPGVHWAGDLRLWLHSAPADMADDDNVAQHLISLRPSNSASDSTPARLELRTGSQRDWLACELVMIP
jgi:hypothetical protein